MQNFGNGKTALGLDANVGALICYLGNLLCGLGGLIYSIIVLVTDKTNKLARFHAFQSILLSVLSIIIGIVFMTIFGVAAATRSSALVGIAWLLYMAVGLAVFVGMIIAAVKGFQGQVFKLPIICDLADKWSN